MSPTTTQGPLRSALYLPGSNSRALEKAKSLAADAIILDLEDAVAPEKKTEARAAIAAALQTRGFGSKQIAIRVNGPDTPWSADDIAMAARSGADAILVPKVESADMIDRISRDVRTAGAPSGLQIWAMIETPLAVLDVRSIAGASRHAGVRLTTLVLGTNDLVKETGATLDRDRTAALYWLSATLAAGRAFGLAVLDGVYNDFRNIEGFAAECRHGRMLGFDGKTLIHPDQLAAANRIFAPTASEMASAERIVAAFALPENAAKGAITIDGRMVERLHAVTAHKLLARARAIWPTYPDALEPPPMP